MIELSTVHSLRMPTSLTELAVQERKLAGKGAAGR